MTQQPLAGQDLLTVQAYDHTQTHHTR